MEKIEPMSNVVCMWPTGGGGYPDGVKLAFRDGNVVTYWREIQQPKPNVTKEYRPKHLKKE